MTLADLSLRSLGTKLRAREISSVELTRWTLDKAEASNRALDAFIRILPENALAAAEKADRDFAAGIDRGPMQGIPYGAKDLFDVAGLPTTCHSKIHKDAVATRDAAVIEKLSMGGAVLVGKMATHEYALYGPDVQLPFPPARNPWNFERITGGSSSGSASAIAGGVLRMALGTDTGGSIRTPSSWSGTVGLKPTFGRVSRRGCFPLSWSLDHCGALTRTVEDAAVALNVLAGFDPLDDDCADVPVSDYTSGLGHSVKGMKIGIARSLLVTASDEVLAGIERVADLLRHSGAEVFDVETPPLAWFGTIIRALLLTEGHHIHEANLRSRVHDFGPLSARRLALGAAYTATDYLACLKVRRMLAQRVSAVFSGCDILLCATTANAAPRYSPVPDPFNPQGPSMTNPFNVTGNPAISVPVGLNSEGMPLSVQLIGKLFDEKTLLQVAQEVETLSGWTEIALPDYTA
ncbi:amidase [Agrobacterium sp. T29]|uniref:amidase n=1 Tax=Agrobacterium sp. T29 TaxID=2580515 RepID=UPI00115DC264|nr:amidase [Agrobacterium sp. T29]